MMKSSCPKKPHSSPRRSLSTTSLSDEDDESFLKALELMAGPQDDLALTFSEKDDDDEDICLSPEAPPHSSPRRSDSTTSLSDEDDQSFLRGLVLMTGPQDDGDNLALTSFEKDDDGHKAIFPSPEAPPHSSPRSQVCSPVWLTDEDDESLLRSLELMSGPQDDGYHLALTSLEKDDDGKAILESPEPLHHSSPHQASSDVLLWDQDQDDDFLTSSLEYDKGNNDPLIRMRLSFEKSCDESCSTVSDSDDEEDGDPSFSSSRADDEDDEDYDSDDDSTLPPPGLWFTPSPCPSSPRDDSKTKRTLPSYLVDPQPCFLVGTEHRPRKRLCISSPTPSDVVDVSPSDVAPTVFRQASTPQPLPSATPATSWTEELGFEPPLRRRTGSILRISSYDEPPVDLDLLEMQEHEADAVDYWERTCHNFRHFNVNESDGRHLRLNQHVRTTMDNQDEQSMTPFDFIDWATLQQENLERSLERMGPHAMMCD